MLATCQVSSPTHSPYLAWGPRLLLATVTNGSDNSKVLDDPLGVHCFPRPGFSAEDSQGEQWLDTGAMVLGVGTHWGEMDNGSPQTRPCCDKGLASGHDFREEGEGLCVSLGVS